MEINGVTTPTTSIYPTTTPPSEPEALELEAAETEDEGTKGVIQNLLNGHYKGVAAVRLQIVHYEELAAIENEQLMASAEEGVAGLLAAIGAGVGEIPEPDEPSPTEGASEVEADAQADIETPTIAGSYNGFIDAVNGIAEDFLSATAPSVDSLVGEIENAFADFTAILQDLLLPPVEEPPADTPPADTPPLLADTPPADEPPADTPPADEPPADTPPADEPPADTPPADTPPDTPPADEPPADTPLLADTPPADEPTGPDYQGLIDELGNVFEAALAELIEALNGVQVLPALSEPSGNGKAYDKFLDIYNELWSIPPANDGSAVDESLDVVT